MKKIILISMLILICGCATNDIKISPAIEGFPVSQDGYNVGPELYVRKGEPAKVTGAVIYIKGTEPEVLTDDGRMIKK